MQLTASSVFSLQSVDGRTIRVDEAGKPSSGRSGGGGGGYRGGGGGGGGGFFRGGRGRGGPRGKGWLMKPQVPVGSGPEQMVLCGTEPRSVEH